MCNRQNLGELLILGDGHQSIQSDLHTHYVWIPLRHAGPNHRLIYHMNTYDMMLPKVYLAEACPAALVDLNVVCDLPASARLPKFAPATACWAS
jgi:hypothetical protein